MASPGPASCPSLSAASGSGNIIPRSVSFKHQTCDLDESIDIFCSQENTFTPHRLATPPGKNFWSLSYDPSTRLVLVVCRPSPLSTHLVYELTSTTLDTGDRVVTLNEVSFLPKNNILIT